MQSAAEGTSSNPFSYPAGEQDRPDDWDGATKSDSDVSHSSYASGAADKRQRPNAPGASPLHVDEDTRRRLSSDFSYAGGGPYPKDAGMNSLSSMAAQVGNSSGRPKETYTTGEPAFRDFVFMRHGESYGNAGKIGHIADGKLTPAGVGKEGEVQAQTRVDMISSSIYGASLLQYFENSDWILTSPLRRAMGTALIVLACVRKQRGIDPDKFWSSKRVKVLNCLRERVQSCSEVPGAGGQGKTADGVFGTHLQTGDWAKVREYLNEICQRYDIEWGIRDTIPTEGPHSFAERMWLSYEIERDATENFMKDAPREGVVFMRLMRDFKEEIRSLGAGPPISIFGHSGWSRCFFAPWFPAATEAQQEFISSLLGYRKAYVLNNCGVVTGSFSSDGLIVPDSVFMDEKVDGGKLPQFDKKPRHAVYVDLSEAKAASTIPVDTELLLSHLWGRKGKKTAKDKTWFFMARNTTSAWLTFGSSRWLDDKAEVATLTSATIAPAGIDDQWHITLADSSSFEVSFDDPDSCKRFLDAFAIASRLDKE